ncbi:jg20510 [Pararge aegeria aegeria]|uniref:Jg20510 protein n=1 Tax=Pararge aegeria aegeria TaxID=348720 RepID=A0A8S4SDR3_9NEOP|nr:jg20510 [Pararge aegeria aegeria]
MAIMETDGHRCGKRGVNQGEQLDFSDKAVRNTSHVMQGTRPANCQAVFINLSRNLRIDMASNPVKFGDDRRTPIFELSNCQIQLLVTMMIFYCWVYMGVDNDLHPLEKSIEENEYGEK